jgi:sensor histidine kinase YesM
MISGKVSTISKAPGCLLRGNFKTALFRFIIINQISINFNNVTNSSSYRAYHVRIKTSSDRFDETRSRVSPWPQILFIINTVLLKYLVHAVLWMFLFFFPSLLLLAVHGNHHTIFFNEIYTGNPAVFILLIIFSYLNYYLLVPRFYIKKAYATYFYIVAAFMCGLIALQHLSALVSVPAFYSQLQAEDYYSSFLPGMNYTLVLFIISMLVSIVILQRSNLDNAETNMMKMKTSFLNTRIHPRFLFNSLNWIYFLATEQSGKTPAAIMQLSGLMRYLLNDASADFVDLRKELNYIENYLALQTGKLDSSVCVNYSVPVYTGTLKISPLLIMPFIENAFRHGVHPGEDSAIDIDISVKGNRICVQVINNKVAATIKVAGSGMGIENARQRLNLLYPCLHHIEILDNNKIYSVKLLINLQ